MLVLVKLRYIEKNNLISVVIPTFNRGNLIGQTIDSILNQSISDFEIIVVDDHSNDNTELILAEYKRRDSRVIYLKRPDHYQKGANSCRNYGFEIAHGDYIMWIDSDDLLSPDALELHLESLKNTNADLSICNSEVFFNNPNELFHRWGNIETEVSLSNFLLGKFRWAIGAGFWRKCYFQSVPPWKEGLMNSQEWLMHFSQLVKNVKLVKVEKTLCLVRAHEGSMSHKSNKSAKYYYHECFARKLAFDLYNLNMVEVSQYSKSKIVRQFIWYHLFMLYKLGFGYFLLCFRFYLSLIRFKLSSN